MRAISRLTVKKVGDTSPPRTHRVNRTLFFIVIVYLIFILDIGVNKEYSSKLYGKNRMIDETDLKILKILQKKARIPNVDVARQVGMAPSAVLERIRKLEKQGIIDGYEVRLNPERFRRSLVCFIHVMVDASAKRADTGKQLASLEAVQEVHFVAGDDGYLVKVRVAGPRELDDLIRDRIETITAVRTTRSYIALSTTKETARIPIEVINDSNQ
jgi:Lrp/AsnC family transcriptional regulator, leucine-responsive regulatory protein